MNNGADNVFVIPDGEDYLVYAPLAGRVLKVNGECLRQVQAFVATRNPSVISPSLFKELEEMRWLDFIPPIPLPHDRLYNPTHVTLLLTGRCNLRCQYCYADGGDYDVRDMPVEIAQKAICFAGAKARRARIPLTVGFHGGGEPTMAWKVLVAATEYAERLAGEIRVPLRLAISTNGVMPGDHARFIAEKFHAVTLSLDGSPDVQNRNRPKADGSGSFQEVENFLGIMKANSTPVYIRSTITAAMVPLLSEMVEFFVCNTSVRDFHFEPAFNAGRCKESIDDDALGIEFAESFASAMDTADRLKANLRFSALRIGGPFLSFCGCSEDPFTVTIDGNITACFEAFHCHQPLSRRFFFGSYDSCEGRFVIDYTKLAKLRQMNVYARATCAACFARWSCSGDCPARYFLEDGETLSKSPRCEMIRRITMYCLKKMAGSSIHG